MSIGAWTVYFANTIKKFRRFRGGGLNAPLNLQLAIVLHISHAFLSYTCVVILTDTNFSYPHLPNIHRSTYLHSVADPKNLKAGRQCIRPVVLYHKCKRRIIYGKKATY